MGGFKEGLRRITSERMRVGEGLYYFAFFLFVLGSILFTTSAEESGYDSVRFLIRAYKLLAGVLLLIKCCKYQRYTREQLICVAVLFVIACISVVVTRDFFFGMTILFVIGGRDIDLRNLAVIALIVYGFVVLFAVGGSLMGYFKNTVLERGGDAEARTSLGFDHPNGLAKALVWITLSIIIIRDTKIDIKLIAIALLVTVIIAVVTDSRTAIMGLLIAVALFKVNELVVGQSDRRRMAWVMFGVVMLLIAVSMFLMVFYDADNPIESGINKLLSQRCALMHWYYTDYPPSLFGQNIAVLPEIAYSAADGEVVTTFLVDNSFARLYLRYGPVAAILLFGSVAVYFWQAIKNDEIDVLMIGMTFCAIYGFGEAVFNSFEYNFFLLGLSYLLYGFPSKPRTEGTLDVSLMAVQGASIIGERIHALQSNWKQ